MLYVDVSSLDEAHCAARDCSNTQPFKMNAPIIPHDNDVLMGRGGKNNQHVGNEKLRALARQRCDNYRFSSKKGKSLMSRELVKLVRGMSPPGRFLKKNSLTSLWEDVGDEIAREKASQALRDAVSALMSNPSDASPEQLDQSMAQISEEHRRSSSEPCVATEHSRYRGKRDRQQQWYEEQSRPSPAYSAAIRPQPVYSTPHDFPPVTPASVTSAKRQRYIPPLTPYEISSLPGPASPIRMPAPYPTPRMRYPTQHSNVNPGFDTPGAILGEIQADPNEFDLFNGELLEDEVDRRGVASHRLSSDTI